MSHIDGFVIPVPPGNKEAGMRYTIALMGPHEVPGESWIVQALDPQGASFALVSPKR